MSSPAEMARSLINTRSLPPGLARLKQLSDEARAYHRLQPYPLFYFRDWRTEDRGPLPRCLALAKGIVKRGAKWIFGKPIQILVPGNETLEMYFQKNWEQNRMPSRLPAMAENAALDTGFVLKFALDESSETPVSFQSLSLIDQVRLYYHPHDRDRILMARVQYSYFDAETGRAMWYREEWTDEEEIHYIPVADEAMTTARKGPDSYEGWEIMPGEAGRKPNVFGLIPLHHCRNYEADDVWGAADLWSPADEDGLYRVIDRINLTYHLMDRSNQFDSEVNEIYIDAAPEADAPDRARQPGEAKYLESRESGDGAVVKGSVVFPPSGNNLRPQMMVYAQDLKKQVLQAASSTEVDEAEITNKGNLTAAVLETIYAPEIARASEKRKSLGTDGIAAFLSLAARGLQNAGVDLGVTANPDSYKIELGWSDWFELSQDEKTTVTNRTMQQVGARVLPHERAVQRIARVEGIQDVKKLQDEVKAMPEETDATQEQDGQSAGGANGASSP